MTAADACTLVTASSIHCAAVDGDVFAAAAVAAAADACTPEAAGSGHCAAVDGDVFAAAVITAPDASTIVAAGSSHRAAADGDVFAAAVGAAADACTTLTTGSVHCTAGDDNVLRSIIFMIAIIAAADTGSRSPAFGRQAAGFFVIVLQGQRSFGFRGVFFKTCPVPAAFQLVIAVQLDLHIAVSLNSQSGFVIGVAHIDLHVSQGEVQHRIGKVVDQRNHRSRGCRGCSSRGCLLGLGLLPDAFLLVCAFRFLSALRLGGVLLPVSVLRLVCAFRFLSVLRLVCAFRLLSVLRLVCAFRFFSALRLGRLVVVLYHRAKAGILCCGAFQVALQRGDGLFMGGDDGLIPDLVRTVLFALLFDGLAAILIFDDGNIAVVDIVGPCKGRSRQRHCDAQRRHQSCCPAECVVLLHRGLLSFSTLSCAFCALFVEGAFFIVPPPPPSLQ